MHASSCIIVVSDKTFDSQNIREGSVSPLPSGIPPGYQTLSPWPPQLAPLPTLESDSKAELEQEKSLPVPNNLVFTWAPSNMLSVQEIYQRIWSGTDIDQVAFNKGGITFWNLQTLDCQENPHLYCDMPDAAGEYSLTRFSKDTEEGEVEVEVEKEEHHSEEEDSKVLLQPIQGSAMTHSNYILGSENASQSISITSEPNPFDQEWEEQIMLQIETMFKLPKTP